MMQQWFAAEVFKEGRYDAKQYVPTAERESFVLSGGSATGKSMPMAHLCKKVAQGFDAHSDTQWKHSGLDLNDAVHMKSEVMRSLLLEPEFLKYGNRLFFDESAHDERRIIRDEMFAYLGEMLKPDSPLINRKLTPQGTGPVILHDRRSTYEHETQVLTADNAKLNYYYFNAPATDTLYRNWGRGAQVLKAMELNGYVPDLDKYAPRFVNARNNINSQESSARRMLEMPAKFADKDIVIPLYSTKAKDFSMEAFGYVDVKHKTIHIRRMPRLVDTVDNAHLAIPEEHHNHPAPLPEPLAKLSRHVKKETKKERDILNTEYAADWLMNLVEKSGYHAYISTPPEEKRTGQVNEQFAEIHPSEDGGKPMLIKTNPELYDRIQAREDGKTSRYETFLKELEARAEKPIAAPDISEPSFEPGLQQERVSNLLFKSGGPKKSHVDYLANRNHEPHKGR